MRMYMTYMHAETDLLTVCVLHGESSTDQASPRTPTQRTCQPQGSSAAPTKPNHTPSRHSRAKGKLLLQTCTCSATVCNRTMQHSANAALQQAVHDSMFVVMAMGSIPLASRPAIMRACNHTSNHCV